uniref:Colony stimulating factor 3 receptor n=1 Tax=Chelonoidis abingdonii TaxID=106734 RepID=A0A8C0HAK3_CHEAB
MEHPHVPCLYVPQASTERTHHMPPSSVTWVSIKSICAWLSQACGWVTVDSPTILLGSTVMASCTIQSNRCGGLEGEEIQITWRLNRESMSGSQHKSIEGAEVSNLTISHFNQTRAKLWCFVVGNGTPQRIGMAEIHAGYPPSKPENLTCMMNLSESSLTCHWDPGLDGHLPATVALKSSKTRGQCEVSQEAIPDCIPQAGQNYCSIPRKFLQLYQKMDIWVSVQNALGTAESQHLCIDPMDVAKLDPPVLKSIQSLPFQTDCVSVAWEVAPTSSHIEQQCELRYRTHEDPGWTLVSDWLWERGPGWLAGAVFLWRKYGLVARTPGICSCLCFRGGTESPSFSPPALKQNEMNGRILGYWVSLNPRQRNVELAAVCNTTEMQCNFSVLAGVRRVYLAAYNSAGESAATEVIFLEKKGQPLAGIHTSPCDEHSLWVHWEAPRAAVTGYILEWCQIPLPGPARSSGSWQVERNRSATKALIRENIEPFQLYNISVYPLYADAVGLPLHTAAYSKEKAPSRAPKFRLKSVSKSHAKLSWDPVPTEMQNGFITNYTIFWASAVVNSSFTTFTVRGLLPSTMYKVHIMASTAAGSTNSTSLTLVTPVLGKAMGLACLGNLTSPWLCYVTNRVKNQFWPSVPDPANSSLGKWVPADLQDPGLVTISDITVLEKGAEKKASLWGKKDPVPAAAGSFPVLPKSYIHPSSSGLPSGSRAPGEARPGSYVNSAGAVQYAKVVAEGYRGQQQHVPSPLYIRSDSTQPLLSESTPSPKPYENLWFHGALQAGLHCQSSQEDVAFLEEPLIDFPLLQGLKIDGAEDLHDFQRF